MTDESYQEFVDYLKQNESVIKEFLDKQKKLSGCSYLNKPSNRFDKGKFAEIPLCNILPELKYEETEGYDATFKGLKVSIKLEKSFFLKRKSKANQKGSCKRVTLKNSNSSLNKEIIEPPDFDALLLISSFQESLAVVKRSNITFVTSGSQVLSERLTADKINFIVEPSDNLVEKQQTKLNEYIQKAKEQWVLDIYSSINQNI